jgi:N-methylhydantoinase A
LSKKKSSEARLAVDIGGTFTDVVLDRGERRTTAKVLTTYPDPAIGFMQGVREAIARAECAPGDIALVVHGTTLATNALIERKGARTALLTTAGFRDVLEIGTESRFALYDLFIRRPEPLVERRFRFEVRERIASDGEVLLPLDEAGVKALVPALEEARVESLAIGFLQAYVNPAHEIRAEGILQEALPRLAITRAADVCGEIREYDRFSTACANAYVRPLMAQYLERLERELAQAGFRCPLLIVTSGGGMTTKDVAQRYPVRLIESGPAGGTILAAEIARACGIERAMSFDMGGTTAKICFIDHGEAQHARSFEAARVYRFAKGSGLPLRIPVIEMVEIGAGGGSIARVDTLNRITVGPDSAAADPGPVSYGRGGTKPTVTDADLVAGRIDPARFAGGSISLQADDARAALGREVGERLHLDADAAASAVVEVVEENMANAARVHAIEGGREAALYTMVAFGGAAPLHAAPLAEKLGMNRVLIPAGAGVGSAIGFLRAPVAFETAISWFQATASLDIEAANERLESVAEQARGIVRQASSEGLVETRRVLMRYRGQGHEIEVPLPSRRLAEGDRREIDGAFIVAYRKLYGRTIPGLGTEILTWLVTVRSPAPPVEPTSWPAATQRLARVARHGTFIDARSGKHTEIAVVERVAVERGTKVVGPAAIVEDDTTTLIPRLWEATVNDRGDLVLVRGDA